MITEKKHRHEVSKTQNVSFPRKRESSYKDSSCLSVLVAKKAFTLVEILTAVVIIAIMLGVLMPAFNMVRHKARDVQQKAQIASIEIGLNLYKNDFGDYPASHGFTGSGTARTANYNYCGAQTLSEAMLGQDLLGVDPNTEYEAGSSIYKVGGTGYNLANRKGPYLDRTHINVFRSANFYNSHNPVENEYMISDVYNVKKATFGNRQYKVGTPVLYYKADVSKTSIDANTPSNSVYDSRDNEDLIKLGSVAKSTNYHYFDSESSHYSQLEPPVDGRKTFYSYIKDPMTSTPTINRPIRPDSFILISAGNDGLYGTSDDICNFEPNIE